MCGRYVSASSPQEIADYFGAASVAEALIDPAVAPEPNYNVAPTTMVPAIISRESERHIDLFRWGLVPRWAKSIKIGYKMINARSETVTTKNAFRSAAKRRRCIIPADAFYEWTAAPDPNSTKPRKQPWCIMRNDGDPFAFAGLWETWRDPDAGDDLSEGADAGWVMSCTVLTREANQAMSRVHDRMPVMVPPDRWQAWLDPDDDDFEALLGSIEPCPSELLTIYPVSTAVNNSRSRGIELLDEIDLAATS